MISSIYIGTSSLIRTKEEKKTNGEVNLQTFQSKVCLHVSRTILCNIFIFICETKEKTSTFLQVFIFGLFKRFLFFSLQFDKERRV